MKLYKRSSAAHKAARDDQPILVIHVGRERLYIVGDFERLDGVELLSPVQPHVSRDGRVSAHSSRCIAGHIRLGHLDRLGNGNHAAAAEYDRANRVWKGWGLSERFINPADQAKCDADDEARKSGS